jgi:FMN-dependent oxidoreductase (nitrilotriacetate monooxygenase family)
MFHTGWFLNHGQSLYGWNSMWSGNAGREFGSPQLWIDMATSMERAGFDYMMIEDASVLPDVYEGGFGHSVRTGVVRHDPMPLVPLLAAHTKSLGIVATASTTFYHPFMAARLFRTLDHLTNGRVGLNLVTGSPHAAAQNFGHPEHFEHDLRYEMADEWMECVTALWDTWDQDAVVLDEETGYFADPSKVHYANFEGRFHKSRGPLNTIPSPQQRPVICQAGGSPSGRDLAAKHSDTVLASVIGIEGMKEYRDDISARAISHGRKPSDIKVLFLVNPVFGDTDQEAAERYERMKVAKAADLTETLSGMSYGSGFDFSKYDLDGPYPDIMGKSNGHQSMVANMTKMGEGKSLRELAAKPRGSMELIGTPDTIAAKMGEAMEEAGGDGFLISLPVTRKNITEVCDGLAPALRRRGLIPGSYPYEHFRDNLLAF